MPGPVDDATLVHIAVKVKQGGGYELSVFPQRHGDTIAFYTKPGEIRAPERPREVVWLGHDLPGGMKLEIQAKDQSMPLLPNRTYEISAANPLVHSGPVQLPGGSLGETWRYNVRLLDSNSLPVVSIDPDVIIKPDP